MFQTDQEKERITQKINEDNNILKMGNTYKQAFKVSPEDTETKLKWRLKTTQ